MRVVMVVYKFPKISETFILRQLDYLRADVVTVEFDTELGKELGRIPHINLTSDIPKRVVRLHKYYRIGIDKVLGCYSSNWLSRVKQRFKDYLVSNPPDVVLAQFGPIGLNCMEICKYLNIPLVVHFHGYDASGLLRDKNYARRLLELFVTAQKLVVVNQTMREIFIDMGCDQSKIELIPCGVPIDQFDIELGPTDIDTVIKFLFVGRLVPKKDPIGLIKAFKSCLSYDFEAKLTIVGGGPLFNDLQKLVVTERLSDRVELTGSLTQDEVKLHYQSAHVYVQHSITADNGDTEGWPVAIAEAMASGLPVISTRHAGIADQVIHNETGFLVQEHDLTSLADCMQRLARDEDLRTKFGANGKARIRRVGSFQQQIRELEVVLKEAIALKNEYSV
jgi:glycosyltransferase involved in cell wall biosynthesis